MNRPRWSRANCSALVFHASASVRVEVVAATSVRAGRRRTFLLDPSQANIDIEVKNVAIEDLRQPPFRARIEFYKIFTSPLDHTEQKRELWTANVVYAFRDQVRNDLLPLIR